MRVYAWEGVRRSCRPSISSRRSSTTRSCYGQIAAANATSDIYAMGGRPLTALAIAAFPKDDLEPEVIRAIFAAASRSCARRAFRSSAVTPSRISRSSSAMP